MYIVYWVLFWSRFLLLLNWYYSFWQKIERLKNGLHLLDMDKKFQQHIVFVDSDKEGMPAITINKLVFVYRWHCVMACELIRDMGLQWNIYFVFIKKCYYGMSQSLIGNEINLIYFNIYEAITQDTACNYSIWYLPWQCKQFLLVK